MSHENFITFNCNYIYIYIYIYIENFNHRFNFCVSNYIVVITDDALLRKAFTDILNCDIYFTYILFDMVNSLNGNTTMILRITMNGQRNNVTKTTLVKPEEGSVKGL